MISYGSGWRKAVVNQCLESGVTITCQRQRPELRRRRDSDLDCIAEEMHNLKFMKGKTKDDEWESMALYRTGSN